MYSLSLPTACDDACCSLRVALYERTEGLLTASANSSKFIVACPSRMLAAAGEAAQAAAAGPSSMQHEERGHGDMLFAFGNVAGVCQE